MMSLGQPLWMSSQKKSSERRQRRWIDVYFFAQWGWALIRPHCPGIQHNLLSLTCIYCCDMNHSGCFRTYTAHTLGIRGMLVRKLARLLPQGPFWSRAKEPEVVCRLFKTSVLSLPLPAVFAFASLVWMFLWGWWHVVWLHAKVCFAVCSLRA